jgi:hypothetical protein
MDYSTTSISVAVCYQWELLISEICKGKARRRCYSPSMNPEKLVFGRFYDRYKDINMKIETFIQYIIILLILLIILTV